MDRRIYMLADQLLLIERKLRVLGQWSKSSPAPEALASSEPLYVDTLVFEQWLQWILLPQTKLIPENDSALPQASDTLAMAEVVYAQRGEKVVGLPAALGEFDRLIGGPSWGFGSKEEPGYRPGFFSLQAKRRAGSTLCCGTGPCSPQR